MPAEYPPEFLAKLAAVTNKRAKIVIAHILKHGHVTNEELEGPYGYGHGPRAARDVRELGIVLETFYLKGKNGRRTGAYRFDAEATMRGGSHGGRKTFSKDFKASLVAAYGEQCGVCLTAYEARYLQIDHRVPYEVAGDVGGDRDLTEYMLVCGSCNRAKSWSCEHCENWTTGLDPAICQTCYWANPTKYAHIAGRLIRRLDVVWAEGEVPDYEKLKAMSEHAKLPLPDFVKAALRDVGET